MQESPKNRKTITAIKHPSPIFRPIVLPLGVALGAAYGPDAWYGGGTWYCDWLWYGPDCGEAVVPGEAAVPNKVPQFAQNFAVSGFANPQFGQFITYAYCNEFGEWKFSSSSERIILA